MASPKELGTSGLLALLLLQESRHGARLDGSGDIVLLADQDRTKWERAAIWEGMCLLGVALRRTPTRPDLYATQAAIAACHVLAPTWCETNLGCGIELVRRAAWINDTPAVRLNRAVAVAEVHGPQAGLDALDAVGSLGESSRVDAVRGDLLFQAGKLPEAGIAYRAALFATG